MKSSIFTILVVLFCQIGFPQSGTITNVTSQQRTDGSRIVDVNFNLTGPGSTYYINLEVSFNGGSTYTPIESQFASGDVGPISPGLNKHIIWNGLQSSINTYSTQTKLKILANTFPLNVTDYDGNVYNTVLIGNQVWMKENLKTTHYRNGASIEFPGSNTAWQNDTLGAYSWYNNDISWKDSYGALYNWHAVNNANGLCPTGWHVPSDAEWTQLTDTTSGGIIWDVNLKSCRQVSSPLPGECNTNDHPRWNYNSTAYSTDNYGFGSLPGGYRYTYEGTFLNLGTYGAWWSSTTVLSDDAWFRYQYYFTNSIGRSYIWKKDGNSVRCLKD